MPCLLTPQDDEAADIAKFREETVSKLEYLATFTVRELSKVPGLNVIVPRGAMYIMVGLDLLKFNAEANIKDDVDFAQKLLLEENVFVLPGKCFGIKNFFRIVFTAPESTLREAYGRIADFCSRHGV